MRTKKQDEECPYPPSSTPRTDEAHARWAQGKVSWIDEMARLELELHEVRDQLDAAMWCLNVGKNAEDPTYSYWLGVTDHTCGSPEPIGACLRCDLQDMLDESLEQARLLGMSAERECSLRGELERWRNCARQLAALGTSKDFQTSGEWNKAMEFYRKLQEQTNET